MQIKKLNTNYPKNRHPEFISGSYQYGVELQAGKMLPSRDILHENKFSAKAVNQVQHDANEFTSFKGRVFVETGWGQIKKLKKIGAQIGKMNVVKNSPADVYISSPFIDMMVRVSAEHPKTKIKSKPIMTVFNANSIADAAKRSISQCEKLIDTHKAEQSGTLLGKIKNIFKG